MRPCRQNTTGSEYAIRFFFLFGSFRPNLTKARGLPIRQPSLLTQCPKSNTYCKYAFIASAINWLCDTLCRFASSMIRRQVCAGRHTVRCSISTEEGLRPAPSRRPPRRSIFSVIVFEIWNFFRKKIICDDKKCRHYSDNMHILSVLY